MTNKFVGIFKLILSPILLCIFIFLANYLPSTQLYIPILIDVGYIILMMINKSANYRMRSLVWRCDRSEGYNKSFADVSSLPFFFKNIILPIITYLIFIGALIALNRFAFNIIDWMKLICYSSAGVLFIDLIISGISDIRNSKYSIDF